MEQDQLYEPLTLIPRARREGARHRHDRHLRCEVEAAFQYSELHIDDEARPPRLSWIIVWEKIFS